MSTASRIFITIFLCVTAIWTKMAWGDDFDFFPSAEIESRETDLDEEVVLTAGNSGPIYIPTKAAKPAIPPLFAEATQTLRQWHHAEDLPMPVANTPPPRRQLASRPEPTETDLLTANALAREKAFRDQLVEANVAPATYQTILKIIMTGKVQTRRIEDNGR